MTTELKGYINYDNENYTFTYNIDTMKRTLHPISKEVYHANNIAIFDDLGKPFSNKWSQKLLLYGELIDKRNAVFYISSNLVMKMKIL